MRFVTNGAVKGYSPKMWTVSAGRIHYLYSVDSSEQRNFVSRIIDQGLKIIYREALMTGDITSVEASIH